jgi:hypothetical protein
LPGRARCPWWSVFEFVWGHRVSGQPSRGATKHTRSHVSTAPSGLQPHHPSTATTRPCHRVKSDVILPLFPILGSFPMGGCSSGFSLLLAAACVRHAPLQRSASPAPNSFGRRLILAQSRAVTAAFELAPRPAVIDHEGPKIALRRKSGMKDAACTPTHLLSLRACAAPTRAWCCHE